MTETFRPRIAAIGIIMLAAMALVPVPREALEGSMTGQMLVQLPLLALAGWLVGRTLPPRLLRPIQGWNRQGVSGAVLISMMAAFWMLPRMLDASLTDVTVSVAKHLSIPLLIGVPLAISWPLMGFVVRGMLVAESLATCFRLGWLYVISPYRLCNNYGLSDQHRLGAALLGIGALWLAWLAWKLLWGGFRTTLSPPTMRHSATVGASTNG